MSEHFKSMRIDWLTFSPNPHDFDADKNNDEEVYHYPLPPEAGNAQANILRTSHNISLYKAYYNYNANFLGQEYQIGPIDVIFDSNVLMIGTVFGASIHDKGEYPKSDLKYGEDQTFFMHSDKLTTYTTHPTTRPFNATHFSLPISSLISLIGQQHAEYLLSALEISIAPTSTTHSVPLRINKILETAVSPKLQGRMKHLYSQAKVLEYLCELIEHIEKQKGVLNKEHKKTLTIHETHDYLSHLDGKLPSIIELAEQANMSAQTLNQAFKQEFGLTIHRFISKQRLIQAHSTIQETSIALKALSARLGYSHVNHFSNAFKREFGYSPGSLRR